MLDAMRIFEIAYDEIFDQRGQQHFKRFVEGAKIVPELLHRCGESLPRNFRRSHGGVKRGRNLGEFRLIGSGLKIRLRCSRNRDGPAHCFSIN